MRRLLLGTLAAAALLGAAARAGEEVPPVKLSDWRLERFRYGQGDKIPKKVVARITAANTGKEPLRGLRARLVYYASTGEKVKETSPQFAMVLPAGGSHPFKFEEGLVPAFEAYEFHLECSVGGEKKKWVWRSPDPFQLPTLWSNEPVKGISRLVLLGREVSPDPRTRLPVLYIRVRNLGEKPAERAAVVLEFVDAKDKVIQKYEQRLGNGTIPGGAEKSYRYTLAKRIAGYKGYRVRLSSAEPSSEEALSGGSFTDKPDLELAEFKFTRKTDGGLHIVAKVRNGRKDPVKDPTAVIILAGKSGKQVKRVPFEITGRLAPGRIKAFALTVPDCPSFGAFSYEIEYSERTAPVFKPVTAQVESGKAGVARIEVKEGENGELRFLARVLSRAPHDVTELKVTVSLMGGPRGEVVGRCAGGLDKLAAGKSATVTAELARPPKFSNFTYNVTYKEPTPPVEKPLKKTESGRVIYK